MMPEQFPVYTVREFIRDSYTLINPSNPTVPLHGDDESRALRILNQLLRHYAGTGLMLTIAKTVTVPINNDIFNVAFVDPTYPTDFVQTESIALTSGVNYFNVFNGAIYNVGDTVTGHGIPALTTIVSIVGNTVTLTQNVTFTGQSILSFSSPIVDPGVVYIKEGRLANLDSAWLVLDGVTYPLIDKSRDEYLASWKYDPLKGLPRFVIIFPDTNKVLCRLYPAPSQFFQFFARGKFQLPYLDKDSDMSILPENYHLYFLYAVARYLSSFKGRAVAWTQKLEDEYRELKDVMEATSEVNLSITGDEQSLLNGAWRVRSGV